VGYSNWKAKDAYKKQLSKAKTKGGRKLFVASTEAILITLVDNCHSKWAKMWEFWVANGIKSKIPKKKTKEEKQKEGINEDEKDEMHDAKYTSSTSGKQTYGTFSLAGLKFFNDLTKKIANHRKDNPKEVHQFEEAYMKDLCKRHKIDDQGGKKRKRKSGEGKTAQKRQEVQEFEFDFVDEE
jgi:hypothetical protein